MSMFSDTTKFKRITINTTDTPVDIDDNCVYVQARNDGASTITVFCSSDPNSYYSLLPTDQVHFRVKAGRQLTAKAVGDASVLEIIMWG